MKKMLVVWGLLSVCTAVAIKEEDGVRPCVVTMPIPAVSRCPSNMGISSTIPCAALFAVYVGRNKRQDVADRRPEKERIAKELKKKMD